MNFWEELDGAVKATVIMIIVVGFALGGGLALYQTFAVPYEDARRDAYEHSQSYIEGATRDLGNLCRDVEKADVGHRALLQDTIRHRYVRLDVNDLPEYLRPCLRAAREE